MSLSMTYTFVPTVTPVEPLAGSFSPASSRQNTFNVCELRAPRFCLELPVRFFSSEGVFVGDCINVSESGVLVAFDQPIDVWLEGQLTATLPDGNISLKARVARVDGRNAGLSFRLQCEAEKLDVQKLLSLAKREEQQA